MRKLKKSVSALLAIVILMSVVLCAPFTVRSYSLEKSGDLWYTVLDDGTAMITEYDGTATQLTIPSNINGYTVTSIGGWPAFQSCTSLTSVTIPNSVTEIGDHAFSDCTNLASITIPDSIIEIGDYAFYGCESLESVKIGNSVTSIGCAVFCRCTSLGSVTIPNSVTSIGRFAFQSCTSLTNVTIPNSVTKIGDSAFSYCTSLASIIVDNINQYYCSVDGVLFSKDKTSLNAYPAGKILKTYSIPNSVTEIGDSAFLGCKNLASVTIPNSVTSIGEFTFCNCTSLTNVTIGNSVTSIDSYAFRKCTSLTSVTIPNSVTSIGVCAFSDCTSLESIKVDNQNQNYCSVDGVLFSKDKTSLITYPAGSTTKTYSIPNSVTSIGDYAFSGCKNLASVTIPNSVTSIGVSAFSYCTSLKDVYYLGTESQWNSISMGTGNTPLINANIHFIDPTKITPISNCTISLATTSYTYDGTAKKPSVTIKDGSTTLTSGTDYTVSYSNNTNVGTATVTITGKGNYSGTVSKSFTINAKSISSTTVTLGTTSYTYDGTAKKPSVTVKDGSTTLTNGTDYTVSYSNNTNAGTATVTITGLGNYTGTAIKNFTITEAPKINISSCTFSLGTTSYTYDGTAKKPSITVKDGSTTLTSGTDYTVSYSNNTNVGTATVSITGKGNYTGTVSKTFTINAKSISSTTVTLGTTSYTYDGTAKKPSVTVKDGTTTLTSGTDYTVSYSNNTNVGTATVTVTGKGNYTGTVSKNFTITNSKQEFTWGQDNWNFNNSYTYFGYGTYRSQINNTYLRELEKNLTNSEYQVIFSGTWYSDAWIDDSWSGSCYGMSSTSLLSKKGLLPYTQYTSGANYLFDLSTPKNDSDINSLITYYQMLQVKSVIQQQYRTVPNKSNKENIGNIISLLDKNNAVLIGFQKNGWGGHAILAYDYEYGSYTWNGVTYQGCIKICDPNCSKNYNNKYNIYFNTNTYNWAIPAYSGITSASGAVFNYVGSNVDEINKGGYLSGNTGNLVSDYVARINALSISDNRSVSKVKQTNGEYFNQNTAPGDIVEDYSYILGGESEGTIGYNLYDNNAAYKITQSNPEELQLSIDYDTCYFTAGSKAGKFVIFDKNGYVQVESESSEYNMSMTFDEDYDTDWFTIQVTGSNADIASLTKVDGGYVLQANNLENVNIGANNKEDSAFTSFSTDYDSVYIYEINSNTIGLKVDTDNNGTYETELKTKLIGDVNGDGSVTVLDATMLQKYLAGLDSFSNEQFAVTDTDGNGDINIKDATQIQRYLANIVTSLG